MSRILSCSGLHTHFLFSLESSIKLSFTRFFFKELNSKGYFLRNVNIYYDLAFFSISISFFKKNIFMLNYIFFNNFKNFLNYFYNATLLGGQFVVVDNDNRIYSPFLHLFYSESFLIKYNAFLKKSDFFFRQLHHLSLSKKFFLKNRTTTLIILNYDNFHKYTPLYSTFNAVMVSFVLPNTRADLLDFFLFKSNKFFYLESIVFLAKIYDVYSLAANISVYKSIIFYKNLYSKIIF